MAPNDYLIGHKKPPLHTQYKPGQTGNPKGRPKGVKNLSTDLQEELESKILITEANQRHVVTKQRAMIKTLFAKALKGDTRAVNVLINLILGLEQTNRNGQVDRVLSKEDQAILDDYKNQLLREFNSNHNGEEQ